MKALERFAVIQLPRLTPRGRLSPRFAGAAVAMLAVTVALHADSGSQKRRGPRPQIGSAFSGSSFYTVKPCRILDTRTPSGAPAVSAGGTRVVSTLPCGVSPTARAVSLNVTVTQPSVSGHLTLYPRDGLLPLASTINFRAGQTRANNALAPLAGGGLTIYSGQPSGTVHVILDVNGYFDDPANNQPPVIDAGPDQVITLPAMATLNGTVSDDDLPAPPSLTISWTKVSGPGTVSFGTPNAAVTTAAFGLAGAYVLRLSASDGELTSSDDVIINVNPPSGDVIRFLEQSTFGPNDTLINYVQAIGVGAYLTEQLNLPSSGWPVLPLQPSTVPPGCDTICQRDNYSMYPLQIRFFTNSLYGHDQLRQRMIWALHQLFVVSGRDINLPSWMLPYIQTLDRNAFGNYRQLLSEITLNPGMGHYLNMDTSTKNNPNENYAREVLQLFSVGTVLLNPDGTPQLDVNGDPLPTYDQATVTNFARVFTGWKLAANVAPGVPDYITPMVLTAANHDTGSKTLLSGAVLPAGQTGDKDLKDALDNIFNHPNVGPYIATHLIHTLVTSNPTPSYVARVAAVFNDNGFGIRGDLSAVVAAILFDPEARSDPPSDPNFGHLREPALFALNLLRALNAKSADLATTSDGYINPQTVSMGQDVFRPATVFSYYPADYLLPGSSSVLAPEFGLLDTSATLKRANFVNTMVFSTIGVGANSPNGTALDLSGLQALASDPVQVVSYLNHLLLHGSMSASMQNSIVNAVSGISASNLRLRAQQALYLVATSSQYQVER